jgi:hypothetical protein
MRRYRAETRDISLNRCDGFIDRLPFAKALPNEKRSKATSAWFDV